MIFWPVAFFIAGVALMTAGGCVDPDGYWEACGRVGDEASDGFEPLRNSSL